MLRYPPRLDRTTKEEIEAYFLDGFEFFEGLFESLHPQAFYIRSEPTRHPMIFYYGHTAVFFINKLYASGLIQERINAEYESIFAVGVDEMAWDDLRDESYDWPSIEDVRSYRQKVKERVLEFIKQTPLELPISWENPYWIILMGCEHERIHIETSSVLHRQMPLEYIRQRDRFAPQTSQAKSPKNDLVRIPAMQVRLGKSKDDPYYGWDNEYGEKLVELDSFEVSRYLVTNGEFLEFVKDGGYEQMEYWDEEGQAFLKRRGAKHPPFWVSDGGSYLYRAYDRLIELPLDFPVDVNALEAEAFCRWKSKRENANYKLLSEAEYHALYSYCYDKKIATSKDANVNFAYGFSSCSVTRFKHKELYDVVGNAWCWSRTPIDAFAGFEVHRAYDDFSTPTFDTKHNLILGASWASSGNELLRESRYAFRKHFYQHASFRYCISNNEDGINEAIEQDGEVVAKLTQEYLEPSYIQSIRQMLPSSLKGKKALDLGCGCGRSTFELAHYFEYVEGLDATARYIKVAVALQKRNYLNYALEGTVELLEFDTSSVRDRVQFWQADENNLKPLYRGYDFILYHGRSMQLLARLKEIVNKGGVVITLQDITEIEGFKRVGAREFVRV